MKSRNRTRRVADLSFSARSKEPENSGPSERTRSDKSATRLLLSWYARHARDLPWRRTTDPFAIWVSEVMLQQTQVTTVVPFFQRFMQAFPNVKALAEADEADVLRLWEGLGYYRRARALHLAARLIMSEHDGILPRDAELLGRLPGLGRYTVNAVLSQAFDDRLPILEANSRRVLCRLLAIEEDPSRADVQKLLWDAAERWLPPRGAGRFNQALMEIGALVCKPAGPLCRECPLTEHCRAFRLGRQNDIPRRPTGPRIEEVREVALVIRKRRALLVVQRSAGGRWAGLWEFPHVPLLGEETHHDAAARLQESLGIKGEVLTELATICHAVTRFRITMVCLEARHRSGTVCADSYAQARWVSAEELAELPLSSPQRRLAKMLKK